MRTFEFSEGTSNKFWNITLSGKTFTVNFGKIGTAGQTQIKELRRRGGREEGARQARRREAQEGLQGDHQGGGRRARARSPAKPRPPRLPKPAKAKAEPPAPAPPPTLGTSPGAAAAAARQRTFEYSDASRTSSGTSSCQGTSFTVTYGRIGTAGQTQDEDVRRRGRRAEGARQARRGEAEEGLPGDDAAAEGRRRRRCASRWRRRWSRTRRPGHHMAYADYLTEQGDPLGDFVRVQLALEDATEAARRAQEAPAAGEEAPRRPRPDLARRPRPVPARQARGRDELATMQAEYTFRRGWLDTLKVELPHRRLHARPGARRRRSACCGIWTSTMAHYDDDQATSSRATDVPEDDDYPASSTRWSAARTWATSGRFIVGELIDAARRTTRTSTALNCHTTATALVGVVKQMPRLEELHLLPTTSTPSSSSR